MRSYSQDINPTHQEIAEGFRKTLEGYKLGDEVSFAKAEILCLLDIIEETNRWAHTCIQDYDASCRLRSESLLEIEQAAIELRNAMHLKSVAEFKLFSLLPKIATDDDHNDHPF